MLDKSLTFGVRLQIIRKQKGMSQSELAEKAGLPQCQISGYENEKHTPELFALEILCKALGVTATKLLGY